MLDHLLFALRDDVSGFNFELSGWSETKVVVRFWIVALIFAVVSLSTLKLR